MLGRSSSLTFIGYGSSCNCVVISDEQLREYRNTGIDCFAWFTNRCIAMARLAFCL